MSSTIFIWINTTIAGIGVLAAFGALNKMRWGQTRPCVILATILIGVGLFGQALSLIWEEWAYYSDTALYGGILALLISSQRVHTWFLERWANPIATVISVVVCALFLIGLLGGCASVPPCERFGFSVIDREGAPAYIAIDMRNMQRLNALIEGIAAGTCRLPAADGTDT